MEAEAELQRQRLVLAQQATARLESLKNDNFVSAAQVQAKTEEMLGVRAQLQALSRQRAAHLREIGTLEAQRRDTDRSLGALRTVAAANEQVTGTIGNLRLPGVTTSARADGLWRHTHRGHAGGRTVAQNLLEV